MNDQSAYARAGVDIRAGDRAVELMKAHIAATHRPEVLSSPGGFAGFFDAAALVHYKHPVLATSTDGVGTKVAIASATGVYDTVGFDLVAMLVDDLVVVGAQPLFVTDYIACGSVIPERIATIVKGISAACGQAGVALIGGETAEHPGLLGPDEFDLAGATTGVVEYDDILGAHLVQPGDRIVCLASSGLHANGYSLVRHVLLEQARMNLETYVEEFGRSLGEELLEPTIVYASGCLAAVRAVTVHAMCHVTGGGLANNLARVIPDNLAAEIDRSTWKPAPIFNLVQRLGGISQPDIEETLNMGVGMVIICPDSSLDQVIKLMTTMGISAWDAGVVKRRIESGMAVQLHSSYL